MTSTSHDPRAWQRPEDSAARPASARLVDPEDDLPSSTYAGDFETTAIPRYDSNPPNPEHSGYGLLNGPEPARMARDERRRMVVATARHAARGLRIAEPNARC